MSATHITAHRRSRTIRVAGVAGLFAALLVSAPMAGALADDDQESPATPILRGADRGFVMSGAGIIHEATQIRGGGGQYIAITGGDDSAGAPLLVADGNPHDMPVVSGEGGVICSHRQNVRSAVIPCS